MHKILLYGSTGWIGGQLITLLQSRGHVLGSTLILGTARLEDRTSLSAELSSVSPTRVYCAAGVTGRPNVDWCESHKVETIRANVVGTLNLADLCEGRGVHCMIFATGCIFEYDDAHPMGSGVGFTESDEPNFDKSWYSRTKGMVETMLRSYATVLILRVRMPISDDLSPRNFVTKILKYDRVVNVPNSMTVLTELLPASILLSERGRVGVYNFCNPGVISHNEILDLYVKYIDASYTYTNFSLSEQSLILAAGRSNNELDCRKLADECKEGEGAIVIHEIHEACEGVFQRMKDNLESEGVYPDNLWKRQSKV